MIPISKIKLLESKYKDAKDEYYKAKMDFIIDVRNIMDMPEIPFIKVNFETQTIFLFQQNKHFRMTDESLDQLKEYLECSKITVDIDKGGYTILTWI